MNAFNRKGITRKGFLTAMGFSTAGLAQVARLNSRLLHPTQTRARQNSASHRDYVCPDYTPNTNHTGIYVAQEKGHGRGYLKITIQ